MYVLRIKEFNFLKINKWINQFITQVKCCTSKALFNKTNQIALNNLNARLRHKSQEKRLKFKDWKISAVLRSQQKTPNLICAASPVDPPP